MTDLFAVTAHIKTYEVYTTDGYLLHILSTDDKIKQYPRFEEIVTINDVSANIIWLSAEDEELHQRAEELWASKFN